MTAGSVQLNQEQFVRLAELAGVLRDDAEACARDKRWRAAALLIAESVEAALLGTIRCCEAELRAAGAWPTETRPLHHLELGALLTVARDAGWLAPTLPHTGDAVELLNGLYWFFSFVNSSSCGPLLSVGFDTHGAATWSEWGVRSTQRWHSSDGWADEHRPKEIASLFPGFLSRWLDPYWRRVVEIAVGFYFDANVPRTLERAVALAQIPLELLTHAVLVDGNYKTASEVRPPSRGIARLLEHYRISTEIPAQFKDLAHVAAREHWKSGPWAVTELRNEVAHVKRDTAIRPREVWVQAWKLIVWYVEMVLLATFAFQGEYGSRLKWPRWVGEVERVPWAE